MKMLKICMLGEFSITCGDKSINDSDSRSSKLWHVLEYLITFRDKKVSQDELLELFWSNEEVSEPASALKMLMFRLRSKLSELDYLSGKSMVRQSRGTYSWNSDMDFDIDVELFELYEKKGFAPDASDEVRLGSLLKAFNIYKGLFLPKSSSQLWVAPIQVYYHGIYKKIVDELVRILTEKRDYDLLAEVTGKAVNIDAFDETFHYYYIKAMADGGNQAGAIAQYYLTKELFYNSYGINLSPRMLELYGEIVKGDNKAQKDLNIIKQDLREQGEVSGAFYCEYEFFKNIYRLESRSLESTGKSIFIGLISIEDYKSQKDLSAVMDKLLEIVHCNLRKDDVYARYSVSQLIVMMPSVTYEDGNVVLSRIVRTYKRENARSTARLTTTLQPVDPPGGIKNLIDVPMVFC